MSEQLINEMAGKKLCFKVNMVCPRGYNITPNDIKRILDSETEQVITSVEIIQEESNA